MDVFIARSVSVFSFFDPFRIPSCLDSEPQSDRSTLLSKSSSASPPSKSYAGGYDFVLYTSIRRYSLTDCHYSYYSMTSSSSSDESTNLADLFFGGL